MRSGVDASASASRLTLCSPQALLKMDCQGLVVRLIQDFVLLTTAVEVAQRWRELAEKLAKVSKQQMDAYESPHRDRNGVVDSEVSRLPSLSREVNRSDVSFTVVPGDRRVGA